MFNPMMTKILEKGGEEKMKTLKILIVLAFACSLVSPCFASLTTGAITVSATIPTLIQAMNVAITPVTPATGGDIWDSSTVANMSGFSGLTVDPVNKIWKAGKYYAMDVAVVDNSGASWYLNHTIVSIKRGATVDNLDYNVNVAMVKVVKGATGIESETSIQKKPFGDSAVTNNALLSKAALSGGWLRIYYGIATGDVAKDAPGTSPILLDKQAGTYTGSVTLTLYP